MIRLPKILKEGLNLMKKPTFEILVNKYKPEHRQTTTHGYDWEFPIEAKSDLDQFGFDWYTVNRISNPLHSDYGKEYITINMFHDAGSRIRHLVHEGLNLVKKHIIHVGDQIKINPSSSIFDTGFMDKYKDDTYTVIDDGIYILVLRSNTDLSFQTSIKPEDAIKIKSSPYIQECLNRLPLIIEGLNLPKKQWYYSLADDQNGGQMMWTGLNSKSLEELKKDLLQYISVDFDVIEKSEIEDEQDRDNYENWVYYRDTPLNDLCSHWNFAVIIHPKPMEDDGMTIDSESGGEGHRLINEGLNLPYKNKYRERASENGITMILSGTFDEILDMRELPDITHNGEFMEWAESEYQTLHRHMTRSNLTPIFLTINNADLIDVDNATINGTFTFTKSYRNIKGWSKHQLISKFMIDFAVSGKEYMMNFNYDEENDMEFYPPLIISKI